MICRASAFPRLWRFTGISVPLKSQCVRLSTFRISEEVKAAVDAKLPVVALESTIVTHGLPYPENLRMANDVESLIRREGAVPATTAFLNGQGVVGLTNAEIETLAQHPAPEKVSRRDILSVLAARKSGGTTIAATMILAHRAGIRVFATGGLGGVHRGVEHTWDISADLEELSRTPVSVVCSGPKAILDVPKTIEYLETKGVPVITYGDGTGGVPGFWTVDSGTPSPFHFQSASEAAAMIRAANDFGLEGGQVFCVPCPQHLALAPDLIEEAITIALAEAERRGISGKAITPFLLDQVRRATGGDSVATNVEFVKNNALMAVKIAKSLVSPDSTDSMLENRLQEPIDNKFSPPPPPPTDWVQFPTRLTPQPPPPPLAERAVRSKMDVLAVGSVCQDMTCTLNTENVSVTSYPGRISTSLGGTAHNVALASAYSGARTRLVSCVGESERETVLASVSPVLDVAGVAVSRGQRTARYVCMNDVNGELIVACSDMENIAKMPSDHVEREFRAADPRVVVLDANLGRETTETLLDLAKDRLVVLEPTSVPKAAQIARMNLGVFPHQSIDVATPNSLELMSMFEEFSYREKFDIDNWFPIVDALPVSEPLSQMKLDVFIRSDPALADIAQSGLLQASIHLLPYIPNLFVTMGSKGVVSFQLIEHLRDRTGGIRGAASGSAYILSNRANSQFGLLIQHFPVPDAIDPKLVRSVNGIGDTFCGSLAAQLAENRVWLRDDGPTKRQAVERAQRAAALSLQTYESVNSAISDIEPAEQV